MQKTDSHFEIKSIVDEIYIMTYETTNIESINRRIADEVRGFEFASCLAIRQEDHYLDGDTKAETLSSMTDYARRLSERIGITNIAYHDYGRIFI